METFIRAKELIPDPDFSGQRIYALKGIDYTGIDPPIVHLIKKISDLEYCFTLQSCYGHFLYKGQTDFRNTDPLPGANGITRIDYRIAYLAFCISRNREGESLLGKLAELTAIEPGYIQFGCAEWFWERQINSYVLQVEPDRFADKDKITVGYEEAILIEKTRNQFFSNLEEMIEKLIS